MSDSQKSGSGFWNSWWPWIIAGFLIFVFKDVPLNGGGDGSSKRPAGQTTEKEVSVGEKEHRSIKFNVNGSKQVSVDVVSMNGQPVDFFIAPLREYERNIYIANLKGLKGAYLVNEEVVKASESVTLRGNGTYVFALRHGNFSNNPFSRDYPPAMVHYKFTIR
jgi:hypothetical protein